MTEELKKGTTRRDFLIRAVKAAAALAATGAAGYRFRTNIIPVADVSGDRAFTLPDFSVAGHAGKMAIATGTDRVRMLNRAIDAIGGIGSFVKTGDRVLIKVNAAFATPPMLCATTNPDLLAEIVRLCRSSGASVAVTDNPINDPVSCFELTGIADAARRSGATLWVPKADSFRPMTLPGGRLIRNWPFLSTPFQGITKLIGVAPVKDHHRAGASMIMKNWYGLLGGTRNVFHQDIHNIVKELALLVKPTLAILDGTMTMMTNGPTGGSVDDLKATGALVVSTDQVAADGFGVTLLGRKAADLPYITKAAAAGAGTANFELLNPVRING